MKNQSSAKVISESPTLDGRMGILSREETDVFAKAYSFAEADIARQLGIYPYYQTIDRNEGPVAIVQGREVIMLGSNNYLGLTTHPEVREAAKQAITDFGTSLTGSRLLNGTHFLHEKLEADLADFFGKPACLVFTTGYQANLGALTALMSENSVIILDKGNHASIYDGARLSKGTTLTYNHEDLADLERVLSSVPSNRGKMVIVDGVFSMEGEIANLPEILKITQKHGARLAIDDAHGLGIVGPNGQGTVAHFGLTDKVDLITGTFSKTLASIGGFVAGEEKVIDFIRHFGRPILFSASLPPPCIAAASKALEILKREPERVTRVNDNANYMRSGLKSLGFNVGHSTTPIVPVIIGDEILTLSLWRELLEAGVYVNSVLYPAVPKDKSLLRTSYTSEHTRAQLDKALEAFAAVRKNHPEAF